MLEKMLQIMAIVFVTFALIVAFTYATWGIPQFIDGATITPNRLTQPADRLLIANHGTCSEAMRATGYLLPIVATPRSRLQQKQRQV